MVVRIVIRIALVEDDKVYMQQIREYLGRYEEDTGREFSVQMFPDGEDITEDYHAEYDIIFMDIQMQFMDGMTAAEKIREKDHGVVIIFLTSMVSYAVKGYEVEAFDYIVKPVSYEIFEIKILQFFLQIFHTTLRFHYTVLCMKEHFVTPALDIIDT